MRQGYPSLAALPHSRSPDGLLDILAEVSGYLAHPS